MNRQVLGRVLVVALLAAFAGCSAAGSLSMEPVESDEQLGEMASTPPEQAGYPEEDVRRTVHEAVENGTATVNGTEPPIDDGVVISYDGGYYDLSQTVVDSHTKREVVVEIDVNATEVSGSTIQFDDLPAQDRQVVQELLDRTQREDHRLEDGYDIGTVEIYGERDVEESVLAGGQEYDAVVHEGTAYPVNVKRSSAVTVNSYEYTATELAGSTEAYADLLRETAVVSLDSLPDDQADIVEEAANGSYYAEDTDDDAFDALVDRFLEQTAVERTEYDAAWLVEYEGQLYVAELEYDRFVEGDPELETISLESS